MTTFSSGLSASISSYLVLKRALGRQYAAEEWVLTHLDRFLAARRVDLVAETFAAWCLTLQHLASGTRRARMRIARNLCLYRRRSEPGCFVPDERLFPPVHQAVRPHIFTDSEIVRLLATARTLARPSNSPLGPENMRLAIVLLATTGLRRGELIRLTMGDYDPPQRTLAIRESKFHKSRLVPLSADTAREVEHLIEIRGRRRLPPRRAARSSGTATRTPAATAVGASAAPYAHSSGGPASGPRRVISHARMTSVTDLPSTRSSGGTAPDSTYRRSCPSWPPTWGTSRSSRPPTTSSSSNPSRPPPARDSPTAAATSSPDPPSGEVRDDRRRPQ